MSAEMFDFLHTVLAQSILEIERKMKTESNAEVIRVQTAALENRAAASEFLCELQKRYEADPEVTELSPEDIGASILSELTVISNAIISCARLMTLPPHQRDNVKITDDGEIQS